MTDEPTARRPADQAGPGPRDRPTDMADAARRDRPADPSEAARRDGPADRPTGPGLVIGLTGPIGCGKSTVAGWLAELGATVIDADRVAHSATAAGTPALAPIRARFGDGVFAPDGSLDRAALAAVVFADDAALRDLEAIVHPEVGRRIAEAMAEARTADAPLIVIEAIKLVEAGRADRYDEVWLVECSPEAQRSRLQGRGMAPDDAERRLAAQGSDLVDRLASRLAETTGAAGPPRVRRLSTDGDPAEVRERVEDLLADALEPLFFERPGTAAG